MRPKLSIIVPVYNEVKTIGAVLKRLLALPVSKQIIVVDDASNDGTREFLGNCSRKHPDILVIFRKANAGKASAVAEGLRKTEGEFVVIQDADLEYYPEDLLLLLDELETKGLDVVYGSRFINRPESILLRSFLANRFLSLLTSLLYFQRISDMETCYKMFSSSIAADLKITSSRFELEPEITARIIRMGYRIHEVPIRFKGRTYADGKKIGLWDGIMAVLALVKFRFLPMGE